MVALSSKFHGANSAGRLPPPRRAGYPTMVASPPERNSKTSLPPLYGIADCLSYRNIVKLRHYRQTGAPVKTQTGHTRLDRCLRINLSAERTLGLLEITECG